MATLMLDDLRDPAPPKPGPAQRAAVTVRARQLSHRRRFAQVGGVLAVIAVLGVGGAVIASSSGSTGGQVIVAQLASVHGSTTTPPVRTLTVTFAGEDETFVVDADPDGTFALTDLPAGHYDVTWEYEESGVDPSPDVQIGTATSAGRMTVELSSGLNTVSIPL